MPAFRFAAKNVFLTYAQASNILNIDMLFDHLTITYTPAKLVVAEEPHADGGIHYHVLMGFASVLQTTVIGFFDCFGHHPNIAAPRSLKASLAYVIKGGNYRCVGWELSTPSVVDIIDQECQNGGTCEDIVVRTVRRGGDKALKLFQSIVGYVELIHAPQVLHQPKLHWPDDFPCVTEPLASAVVCFLCDVIMGRGLRGDRKSLWITGESRLGKTMLARSLGTHWYMGMMWNVKAFDDEADYGVLDDIPWEFMKGHFKGIMGCQQDITVTDKYCRKRVLKHGRPVIILSNYMPEAEMDDRLWLDANVVFVNINRKIYVD